MKKMIIYNYINTKEWRNKRWQNIKDNNYGNVIDVWKSWMVRA